MVEQNFSKLYKAFKVENRITDEDVAKILGFSDANTFRNSSAYPRYIRAIILLIESQYEVAWNTCKRCGYMNTDTVQDNGACTQCGTSFGFK